MDILDDVRRLSNHTLDLHDGDLVSELERTRLQGWPAYQKEGGKKDEEQQNNGQNPEQDSSSFHRNLLDRSHSIILRIVQSSEILIVSKGAA